MDSLDGQDFIFVGDNDLAGYEEELLPQPPEVLANILKWLQPTDYLGEASEYNKHLSSYVAGTDLWIQQTEAYRQWHDSPDHGNLWTKAIAGAGKSVFAAMITAHLARMEKVPVLFFFFRQIVATNHDPQSLARDWIAMVLKHSPCLQAKMKKHMDGCRMLENISTNEFWQDLIHALASLPQVYCIVDALDEMDVDQEDFLERLIALGKRKPSSIKLIMTSRPLPRIERVLKDPSILQIRLEQLNVDKDISLYVHYRLQNRTDLDDAVRAEINHSIGERSQGSFLYARLMMDEILDHTKHMIPKADFLQRSLDWLPLTLEDMYNGMLLDHSLRSRVPQKLQLTILQWVTHSSRPLRLLELAAILDCQKDIGTVAKDTKAVLRAACGPLLEILEDETISVIHHSFTEFLIDTERKTRSASNGTHPQFPVIDPATTHNVMALACLKYLSSGCMDEWNWKDTVESDYEIHLNLQPPQSQQTIRMRYPFFEYASSDWYVHVSKLDSISTLLLEALNSFMTPGKHAWCAWLDMNWPSNVGLLTVSPLHVASWAGMTSYAQHLLQMEMNSNCRDRSGRTPLSWASARGHVDVVALLLQSVSQPDVDDYSGKKPLHYAALANHYKIVKLLLVAGVSPTTGKTEDVGRYCWNGRSTIGDTPLMYCCDAGSVESVSEMMPYLKREELNKALCWAARSGKTEVVELLLTSPDTSVDDTVYTYTPLFLASSGHYFDTMRLLSQRGADPNRRSATVYPNKRKFDNDPLYIAKFGLTPLHTMCGATTRSASLYSDRETAKKCFQLLFEAGCDINAADFAGKTPLHYSVTPTQSWTPNDGLIKLLLEHGAHAMDQDNSGNTPLHLVQLNGDSKAIIEVLMANGADAAKRNLSGQTPIHVMLEAMQLVSIKDLLPYVSDWNIQDSQGNTPLHIVLSKSCDAEIVLKDLLDAGADLGRRNKKGEAPIHVLGELSKTSVERSKSLSILLKAGADLNMRDAEGRTVLLRFLSNGGNLGNNYESVRFFLEHGSDINARDFEGNGALHQVCKICHSTTLLKLLIDAGADQFLLNHAGNTLLHELFYNFELYGSVMTLKAAVTMLLDLGISAAARNNMGQTALHLACGNVSRKGWGNQYKLFDFVLDTAIGESINAEDNDGVRPIHLISTISEPFLARMIERGADATALTHEGKNLLHITARARQTNSLGLLLEHFVAIGRTDIVDAPDDTGRTALHEACRSGRPESVALLLKAGANSNFRDKRGFSPLHTCAEFQEENLFWSPAASRLSPTRRMAACGILESDPLRPEPSASFNLKNRNRSVWRGVSAEYQTVRLREIIRLLIDHGAELTPNGWIWDDTPSPLKLAIKKCVPEMVEELLKHLEKQAAKSEEEKGPSRSLFRGDEFSERYLIGMTQATVLESDFPRNGDNFWLCEKLLALGKSSTIEKLPAMGVDLLAKPPDWNDFFATLTKWGYASLLETLGATISDPRWVDGKFSREGRGRKLTVPYLIIAASRELPNLDVLKVLVEKLNADVNAHGRDGTALHVLARGSHWWQTEGMRYLLQHGANIELKNKKGQTPLHAAVSRFYCRNAYRKRQIVKLLLDHGANPDATADDGSTCLNQSMQDVELVRLLLGYGADIALGDDPALFSAISVQDVAKVSTIVRAGASCNVRQKAKPYEPPVMPQIKEIQRYEYYPVHYAADRHFNTPRTKERAIEIIKLLLDNGADPFLNFRDDATIIHNLFEFGGILQPFLAIPNLHLERRDPKGRTLLLAAARSGFGTFSPSLVHNDLASKNGQERDAAQENLEVRDPLPAQTLYDMGGDLLAVDNEGNNVLHFLSMASVNNVDEYRKTFSLFMEKAPFLIHQRNNDGWRPFHRAIQDHKLWIAKRLIEAGADPLEEDPEGDTPLHHLAPMMSQVTAETEWLAGWETFIALGVPINAKNNKGETAVFGYFHGGRYGPENYHRKHLNPFEDASADLFVRNNDGETLLHIVATKPFRAPKGIQEENAPPLDTADTFRLLMEKGLDPMAEDNSQRTALDVAAACSNAAVLALFKRDKILEPGPIPGRDSDR